MKSIGFYLSGKRVNWELGDFLVPAAWEDLQNLRVIIRVFQSGSISTGWRCGRRVARECGRDSQGISANDTTPSPRPTGSLVLWPRFLAFVFSSSLEPTSFPRVGAFSAASCGCAFS